MDMIENERKFPNKPVIDLQQDDISKSMFNIILFLGISYFYFDKNISLILTVFLILLIHELGHLFAMRFFDYKNVKVFFIPLLGAYTTGSKTEISQKQSVIIYLAGPLPGLIIAIGLYYYGYYFQNNFIYHAAYYMFFINLFNLLPIKPLDGGNVLSVLFYSSKRDFQIAFIIFSGIAMIAVSLYLKAYFLLLLPLFIILGQIRQFKIEKIKNRLLQNNVILDKDYNDLTNEEYWLIRTEIVKSFTFSPKIDPELMKLSDQENKVVKYVKSVINEVKITFDIENGFRKVIVFVLFLSFIIPIYYIMEMKGNDPKKNNTKTMYELLSYKDIQKMKSGVIANLGNKVPYDTKVKFCDCYVDKILLMKKAEFERIFKLPKEVQMDSIKPLISDCMKILDDTTTINKN